MYFFRCSIALCCLLMLGTVPGNTSSPLPEAPESLQTLPLEEVLRLTLENDPNIAIAHTRVESAEGSLLAAGSSFEPLLNANFAGDHLVSAGSESDGIDLGAGFSKRLRNSRSLSSGIDFSRIDPAGGSNISNTASVFFSLTQPLLRGRGQDIATASERSAQQQLDATTLDLYHSLSRRLLSVTTSYWQLESSRRRLEILRTTEEISERILATTRRLVAADLTPAAEIIQLEADLTSRTADRLSGEQSLFAAIQRLGVEIGLEPEMIRELPLPSTPFPRIDPQGLQHPDYDLWIDFALQRRADLAATERRLESAEILVVQAADGLKPRLDLVLRPSYSGSVSGSGIDDFFSPAFDNVPGVSAVVSLNYSLPIFNQGAQAEWIQRRAAEESSVLQHTLLRRMIAADVSIALDAVRRNAEQLELISHSVELFRKTLENEEKKLRAGSSTLIDVITQRNRLTSAQQQQVGIELELALALADLRFQTGTLIDATRYDPETREGRMTTEHVVSLPDPYEEP